MGADFGTGKSGSGVQDGGQGGGECIDEGERMDWLGFLRSGMKGPMTSALNRLLLLVVVVAVVVGLEEAEVERAIVMSGLALRCLNEIASASLPVVVDRCESENMCRSPTAEEGCRESLVLLDWVEDLL